MDRFELRRSFQLNDESAFNEKVESVFTNLMVFIEERYRVLPNELNPTKRKFDGKRVLINIF